MPKKREYNLSEERLQAKAALTAAVLEASLSILREDGLAGLTARKLAEEAGATTKVIYSHYGGMPGVWKALYAHGFDALEYRIRRRLSKAPNDQESKLKAIATSYCEFAFSDRHLFDLMYGIAILEHLPAVDDRKIATASLAPLIEVFEDENDPVDRARQFWASMHGIVALGVTDWFDRNETNQRLSVLVDAHI